MIRQNPYRHSPPPGWNDSDSAPRDGTLIELQNNWGIAPTYSLCRWIPDRGWIVYGNSSRGVGDGDHISWRPFTGDPDQYVDPTGGAQETEAYWHQAIRRAGYIGPLSTDPSPSPRLSILSEPDDELYQETDDNGLAAVMAILGITLLIVIFLIAGFFDKI